MFGNDEYLRHQTNPFCLSAAISSFTSFTMMPFLTRRRCFVLQRLELAGRVDAQRVERDDVERLFLRLHDVRQLHVARLVQAQIGREDRRQIDFDGFQTRVDFARHFRLAAVEFDLRGEGRLRTLPQRGQHLTGLAVVVVDALLAEQHDLRRLLLDELEENSSRRPAVRPALSACTRIARSAPMASPVRSCCCVSAGPMLTTITSVAPPFSLIRRASSSAISSNGLMLIFTPSVTTPEPSGLTRTRTL